MPAGPFTGTIVGTEAAVVGQPVNPLDDEAMEGGCRRGTRRPLPAPAPPRRVPARLIAPRPDGVRRLPLSRIARRFLDSELECEFREALRAPSSGQANNRRRVWADLKGDGS